MTIAVGIGLGVAGTQALFWFLYDYASYSQSVFVIYVVLLGAFMITSRASFRLLDELVLRRRRGGRRAVIYGAGERAGVALRQLQDHDDGDLRILGFLDDDPRLARTSVHGHQVLGGGDTLERLIAGKEVDLVILNAPAVEPARMREIVALGDANDVPILGLHISLEPVVVSPSPASPASSDA